MQFINKIMHFMVVLGSKVDIQGLLSGQNGQYNYICVPPAGSTTVPWYLYHNTE